MAASSAAVEEIEEFKVNASFRNGVLTMSEWAQRQAKRIAIYTRREGTFGGDRRKRQRRSSNAATREEGNNS